MKARFITLLLSVTVFAGCNDGVESHLKPEDKARVSFDFGSVVCTGELREGVNSQDSDNINPDMLPFVELPFSGSTGARVSIEDLEMPAGLSVSGTYQLPVAGSGILAIPVRGTPSLTGEHTMKFRVLHAEQSDEVVLPVRILGATEEAAGLEIVSVGVNATIMRGTPVKPDAQGRQNIEITYCEGWGRTVTFAIASPSALAIPEGSATVRLSGGSYRKSVTLPLTGYYDGSDSGIDIVVSARTPDMPSDPTGSVADIATTAPAAFDFEAAVDAILQETKPVGGNGRIGITYSGGEFRDVTMTVTPLNQINGLSLGSFPAQYTLEESNGNIFIPLEGTPSTYGDWGLEITFTGHGIDAAGLKKTLSVAVDELVDPITVTAITFDGPFIEGTSSDTTFKIGISYTGGKAGKRIAVSSLGGYVTCDEAKLAAAAPGLAVDGAGSVTIDLGANPFLSTELNASSAFPSNKSIDVGLTYNGYALDINPSVSKVGVTVKGFVWQSKVYNQLNVGGAYWLDRNLGASSTNVAVPTTNGDGVITGWTPDYSAFGGYFQRGRATGIYIQYGGNDNPTPGYPASEPYFKGSGGTWADGVWETPPASVCPANSNTAGNISTLESFWNPASAGGQNNPCPTGYRVPTQSELTAMIDEILPGDGFPTVASQTYLPQLMTSVMRFPLSGAIMNNGPSSTGTGAGKGEVGIPGMRDSNGNLNAATAGEIFLNVYDFFSGAANAGYLTPVQFKAAGTVLTTQTLNKNYAIPVRCIRHQ